ncbi:MAG: macro domain-containing protein [Nannocystaceae bacterium]
MAVDNTEQVTIQICTDPWEQVDVDVFVCPTNSKGLMTTYPASKLKDLAGAHVEDLIRAHAPIAVGAAFVTDAGPMKAKHLVHVPNTDEPGGRVQVEDILRATAAVLVTCAVKNFHSIAIPLMGAFDEGIPAEEAARAIHSEFRSYRGDRSLLVLLMAKDADEVEVFEMAIEGTG